MEKIDYDEQDLAQGGEDSVWERLLTEPQSDAGPRIVASPKVLSKINYIFEKKPLDKLFVRSKP